jgi:alkylated DNA repair dioxygenase AlkB
VETDKPKMKISEEYPTASILPYDGVVRYFGIIFDRAERALLMENLLKEVPWENDVTHMFGKRIVTARKVAWFSDRNTAYSYSGSVKIPHQWTETLLAIKERVEELTGEKYNSCLLNLYHHGGEGMGWHSDDEKSIEAGSSIASVSFGAERKFSFKHKTTKEVVSIVLENGSILDMRGETQQCWLHQLPKTKKVVQPRINLTFRKML